MSNEPNLTPANAVAYQAEMLRRFWRVLLLLGIGLVLLGLTALSCMSLAKDVAIWYLGIVLVVSGIANISYGWQARGWEGAYLSMLAGVVDLGIGLLMFLETEKVAVIITLLLAMFLFINGLFRILAAVSLRFPSWPWALATGALAMLLGVAIWRRWPLDADYVIGLFLGIDLLARGWVLIMLGLAVRPLAGKAAPPA
jgi:uncharacterized membrane protein HdeD (DUF308 family)